MRDAYKNGCLCAFLSKTDARCAFLSSWNPAAGRYHMLQHAEAHPTCATRKQVVLYHPEQKVLTRTAARKQRLRFRLVLPQRYWAEPCPPTLPWRSIADSYTTTGHRSSWKHPSVFSAPHLWLKDKGQSDQTNWRREKKGQGTITIQRFQFVFTTYHAN